MPSPYEESRDLSTTQSPILVVLTSFRALKSALRSISISVQTRMVSAPFLAMIWMPCAHLQVCGINILQWSKVLRHHEQEYTNEGHPSLSSPHSRISHFPLDFFHLFPSLQHARSSLSARTISLMPTSSQRAPFSSTQPRWFSRRAGLRSSLMPFPASSSSVLSLA